MANIKTSKDKKALKDKLRKLEDLGFRVGMYDLASLLDSSENNSPAAEEAIKRGAQRDIDRPAEDGAHAFRQEGKRKVLEGLHGKKSAPSPGEEYTDDWHPPTEAELEALVAGEQKPRREEKPDAFHDAVYVSAHKGFWEGDWDKAKALIAAGAKPDEEMIHYSYSRLSLRWTEMFVKANPQAASEALATAVRNEYRAETELLLKAGATPKGEEEGVFFHSEPVRSPKRHRGLLRGNKSRPLEPAFSDVKGPSARDRQGAQQEAVRDKLLEQRTIQPATTKEYVDWLEKYFKRGGMFTLAAPEDMGDQVHTAQHSMNLPALYGSSKLTLIVPARVSVKPSGEDFGHSDLLLAGGGGNPNSVALYKDTVAELKRRGYSLQKLIGLYDGPEWNRQDDLEAIKSSFAAAAAPAKPANRKPMKGPQL